MTTDVINVDPEIMNGTPVFHGTRVPVSILFDYLEDNRMDAFMENYPSVTREQIIEVIKIASEIFSHKELIHENIA